MRPVLIALVLALVTAFAMPAAGLSPTIAPSSMPGDASGMSCDPETAPFNECGFNCMPGPNYYLCNNAVQLGACVMLTLHGRVC
jgi:hypothetical protein